jgi:hypothetical protein
MLVSMLLELCGNGTGPGAETSPFSTLSNSASDTLYFAQSLLKRVSSEVGPETNAMAASIFCISEGLYAE